MLDAYCVYDKIKARWCSVSDIHQSITKLSEIITLVDEASSAQIQENYGSRAQTELEIYQLVPHQSNALPIPAL